MSPLGSETQMEIEVEVFFNYRSPYCYIASRRMWQLEDEHGAHFVWRPLGGWDGRSAPERLKQKLLVVRQDVARWAKRLAIPFVPPPPNADPTLAAAAALYAVEQGLIRPYTIAVMHAAWGEGRDLGDPQILLPVAASVGLDRDALAGALEDPARRATLTANAAEAFERSIFGVPTFAIGDQLFWGQDRIDFVAEHLEALRAAEGERAC